jgi:tRNA threonylcarbamoyladenosine biosynthesis protein TsaB
MKILALDFSSEQRGVAVLSNDAGASRVLAAASETGGRSTRAIGLIEKVLADAKIEREEIECLAVGLGPGSYTGIRASIAVAQGWQLAKNLRTLGISSVECLARQAQREKAFGRINIVVDAQRNEFYRATYEISESALNEIRRLELVAFQEIEAHAKAGETILGPDVQPFGGTVLLPDAAMLGQIAATRTDFVSAEKLEPIYLREVNFVKAPQPRQIG